MFKLRYVVRWTVRTKVDIVITSFWYDTRENKLSFHTKTGNDIRQYLESCPWLVIAIAIFMFPINPIPKTRKASSRRDTTGLTCGLHMNRPVSVTRNISWEQVLGFDRFRVFIIAPPRSLVFQYINRTSFRKAWQQFKSQLDDFFRLFAWRTLRLCFFHQLL